jgi:F420-non-reducing hydrogenase small subunit
MPKSFAVLQLSGCAGCEVGLINAEEWIGHYKLEYMPLVLSSDDFPPVDTLDQGAVHR